MMADCVFCRIVEGSIPSIKITEEKNMIAILDIHPCAKGHGLIIPCHHAGNARDFFANEWKDMMELARKVGESQMHALGAKGFHLVMNNEPAAEQVVMHAHLHVIPRYPGDGLKLSLPPLQVSQDELREVGKRLQADLK